MKTSASIVVLVIVVCLAFSGCIINNDNNKSESDIFTFLFVETMSYNYTELVSGNYTDGHGDVDFPTYFVNETNSTVSSWYSHEGTFKLLYGSGGWCGGLMLSGAGTGLEFINETPFRINETVHMGNYSFNVSLEITSNLTFYVNGTVLSSGQFLNYSYDFQAPYNNYNSNETCIIRYYGWTIIKNYGIWNNTQIYYMQ